MHATTISPWSRADLNHGNDICVAFALDRSAVDGNNGVTRKHATRAVGGQQRIHFLHHHGPPRSLVVVHQPALCERT